MTGRTRARRRDATGRVRGDVAVLWLLRDRAAADDDLRCSNAWWIILRDSPGGYQVRGARGWHSATAFVRRVISDEVHFVRDGRWTQRASTG